MKTKFLLFLLLATCFAMQAQTIVVSGPQSGVWEADTVLVVGDVAVDESLTVLPGTKVLFDGYYGIFVNKNASFEALGKERDSIVFTALDTTDYAHYYDYKGAWKGFQVERAGRFQLDYCLLEYGKALDSLDFFGGALNILNCETVSIHHSTFHHNAAYKRGGAINAMNSKVEMKGCLLHHNTVLDTIDMYNYGGAACFLKCEVKMREMEFRANDGSRCIGGALSIDSCGVTLDRSVFVDNVGVNGGGLYLMRCNDLKCKLSNLLFDHNYTRHFGGGFALSDASPEVSNVLVYNNSSEGVSCNGVFFYGHCSPKMMNCIIYGNYAPDMTLIVDTSQMWAWTYDGTGPEFYNCLVEGGSNYIHSPENVLAFENIIDADPKFVDAANHDFRLAEGSPCIDAGDPHTPSYVLDGLDLGGQLRVCGRGIDIGPYEYSGAFVHQYPALDAFAKLVGNPLGAHSCIEFDQSMEGEVVLTVYSLTGHTVATEVFNLKGSRRLAIGALTNRLASGVYLIEVVGKDSKCTFRAVK